MEKLMQHKGKCSRAIWGSVLILLSICAIFFFKGGVPVHAEETEGISATRYIKPSDGERREYTGESDEDGTYVTGDKLTLSIEVNGLSEGQYVEYQWSDNDGNDLEKGNTNAIDITKKGNQDGSYADYYYCDYVVYDAEGSWVTNDSCSFSIVTKETIQDYTSYITYDGQQYESWSWEVDQLSINVGDKVQLSIDVKTDYANGELTYQWYKQVINQDGDYEDKKLEGETDNVIEATKRRCQSETYKCRVFDGNEVRYIEISIPATKTLKVSQRINKKDYDSDNPSNNEFVAGDNVTLEIDAASDYIPEEGDKTNITYQWRKCNENDEYDDIEGETDTTCTIIKGMGGENYSCEVSDGNQTQTYYFYVYSKRTLDYDAYIIYNNEQYGPSEDFSMPVDTEAELKVNASSNNAEVTYKWLQYNYNTDKWDSLETTNQSVIVKKTFKGQEQYCCIINDGNDEQKLYFYLPPEKTLTAIQKINNEDYQYDADNGYSVLKGTTVKLEVDADSTYVPEEGGKAHITYQWYKAGYNEDNYYDYYEIKGENLSTYSFEKAVGDEAYYCRVNDGNPNSDYNTYYFKISPVQTLKSVDGYITHNKETYDRDQSFDVKEGDTLILTASAKTEFKNGTVSYQWLKENKDGDQIKVENGTSATLTIKKNGLRKEVYTCQISDGNDEYELDFHIPAVKTLFIKTQKINGRETNRYTSEKGAEITLSVEAESNYTDKGNKPELTYEWYSEQDDVIEGETTSSYMIKKGDGRQKYYCTISDGVSYETVCFYLYQKETLKVTSYINDEDTDGISAVEGKSYKLSVNATSTRLSAIQYEWYVEDENGDDTGYPSEDNICKDSSITVKKSSANEDSYCVRVSDGNESHVYSFSLYLKNEDSSDNINIVQYINDNYYEDYMDYTAEKLPITLKVEASAESGRELTYRWQKSKNMEEDFEDITTAKGNTYKVSSLEEKRMYYRCVVTCGNSEDNRQVADFTLIRPAFIKITQNVKVNGKSVKADDEDEYTVTKDSEVTLTVDAQKIANSTNYTYAWENPDNEKIEADAKTPNVYTIRAFDDTDRGYYTCTVSDGTYTEIVYFYLKISDDSQNQEEITIKPFINGKQTRECEVESVNDAIELKVSASSNKDSNALEYEWYQNSDSDYTTVPLQKGGTAYKVKPEDFRGNYCNIVCKVKGERDSEYQSFYIYLKSYVYDFYSVITKDKIQQKKDEVRAAQGDLLKLELLPTANSNADKKVSYVWYNSDGERLSEESFITVKKAAGKEIYRCKVKDGNYTKTYAFTLYPEEAVIARALINDFGCDEYKAKVGETVKLEADVSSPKPVTYTWYRRTKTMEKLEGQTSSRLSRKIEGPDEYVCIVKSGNSLKKIFFYIYISNEDIPDISDTPSKPTTPTKPSTPAKPVTPTKPTKPVLKVGTKVKDKKTKAVYKVTGKNTVEYVKTTSKAKSITISATVTVKGVKCKVTSIAAKAFKGNKKVQKLIIPASVRKIGKQAFVNCKKLKNITIKTSYLTNKSVGAGAFKGVHAKAVIKVPKKKLKAYKKLLKAKGVGKKAVIKK